MLEVVLHYQSFSLLNYTTQYHHRQAFHYVQDTWELQEKYIVEDKIGKYQNHYYARFKGGKVEEVWKLGCDDVLDLLLPKIKKQFNEGTSHKKDPRIGVSIGQKEIENYGQRIR